MEDGGTLTARLSVPKPDGLGVAGWVEMFGDGSERVEISYDDIPGPWVYTVEGHAMSGQVTVTRLTITQRNPDNPVSISQTRLRKAQLGLVFDRVKRALRTNSADRVVQLLGDMRTQLPKVGRSWPPEHYLQVAWYYVYAEATGRAPRKVVAEHWNVAGITASRWLSEARKLGFLAAYRPGAKLGRATAYPRPPEEPTEAQLDRARQRLPAAKLDQYREEHQKSEEIRYRAERLEESSRQQKVSIVLAHTVFTSVLQGLAQSEFHESAPQEAAVSFARNLLVRAGQAVEAIASISDGEQLLRDALLVDDLGAIAQHASTSELRTAAAKLIDALTGELA